MRAAFSRTNTGASTPRRRRTHLVAMPPATDLEPGWLTLEDAALELDLSLSRVRNYVYDGRMPTTVRGGARGLTRRQLEDFMAHRPQPTHPCKMLQVYRCSCGALPFARDWDLHVQEPGHHERVGDADPEGIPWVEGDGI